MPPTQPLISVTNLHHTYRLGRVDVPVLRGVNLSVAKGEFVAILGASGSGKSTLLHLMGGLDRPFASGSETTVGARIDYLGRDITTLSPSALDAYRSRDIGFVFQFYHLLPELSVLHNVVIGAMIRHGVSFAAHKSEATASAASLLDAVGLSHRLKHRPAELSGGERQRVAIARALINNPTLLLADEPTGNLDRETGRSILEMLLSIRRQREQTFVIVTHDPETASRADRIVRLVDGTVIAA
jgi:lipoprotein-releasing system ATP-binding protein